LKNQSRCSFFSSRMRHLKIDCVIKLQVGSPAKERLLSYLAWKVPHIVLFLDSMVFLLNNIGSNTFKM
jgi:hypothetical protein